MPAPGRAYEPKPEAGLWLRTSRTFAANVWWFLMSPGSDNLRKAPAAAPSSRSFRLPRSLLPGRVAVGEAEAVAHDVLDAVLEDD